MQWHPDRNQAPDAQERYKEIAKAYAVLSDPKKCAKCDARGFEGSSHSHDDLFRGMDLGSIFGDLGFGFGPGGESIFDRFQQIHNCPRCNGTGVTADKPGGRCGVRGEDGRTHPERRRAGENTERRPLRLCGEKFATTAGDVQGTGAPALASKGLIANLRILTGSLGYMRK